MPERMMDEFGRGAIWLLKFAAVYVLTIILLIMVARAFASPPPPRRVIIQPTRQEARWIKQRYTHHGIWVSIEENGEKYFIRNGKQCKL